MNAAVRDKWKGRLSISEAVAVIAMRDRRGPEKFGMAANRARNRIKDHIRKGLLNVDPDGTVDTGELAQWARRWIRFGKFRDLPFPQLVMTGNIIEGPEGGAGQAAMAPSPSTVAECHALILSLTAENADLRQRLAVAETIISTTRSGPRRE